jgi:hypothetical protein
MKLDTKTLSLRGIAKKHNVSIASLKKQLKQGEKVEKEHTSNLKARREIARDHLGELPDYYTRLKKMEEGREMKQLRQIVEGDVVSFKTKKAGGARLSHFPSTHEYFDGAHNACYGESVKDHFIHNHDLAHYVKAENRLSGHDDLFEQGFAHGVALSRWHEMDGGKEPKSKLVGNLFNRMSHYYGVAANPDGRPKGNLGSTIREPDYDKVDEYMERDYKRFHAEEY